ncbi:MAG: serine hydrolase domain-containing protein [SAR324 cluster bacterium]
MRTIVLRAGKAAGYFAAVVVASLCGAAAAVGDPLPRAKPEAVGMSSAKLERIGAMLREDVAKGRIPGAVVAIARRGKLAYFEAVGYRDKAAGALMTTDAIFSVASMTKPMTTVAALTLTEEARILLDDPVGKYLPALANRRVAVLRTDASGKTTIDTVPAQRQPTIQDLMRHTSGLLYGGRGSTALHALYPPSSSRSAALYSGAEFIDKLGTLPLMYQPGTVWDYSLAVDVLGQVVEKVAGKSLGAVLQERLFQPLGMVDTGFIVPPEKSGRYAHALPDDPETGKPQTMMDATRPNKFDCGGGCAVSTAGDYVRFAQMLLNKGQLDGVRILSRKTVEHMTSDQLGPEVRNLIADVDSTRIGYSFGLGLAVRKETGLSPLIGSTGDYSWGGAYGTNFWVDPREQLVVVFMAHAPGAIRVHYRQVMNVLVEEAIAD